MGKEGSTPDAHASNSKAWSGLSSSWTSGNRVSRLIPSGGKWSQQSYEFQDPCFPQKQTLISFLTLWNSWWVPSVDWNIPQKYSPHSQGRAFLPNCLVFPVTSAKELLYLPGCWLETTAITNGTYKARGCLSACLLILITPNCCHRTSPNNEEEAVAEL